VLLDQKHDLALTLGKTMIGASASITTTSDPVAAKIGALVIYLVLAIAEIFFKRYLHGRSKKRPHNTVATTRPRDNTGRFAAITKSEKK